MKQQGGIIGICDRQGANCWASIRVTTFVMFNDAAASTSNAHYIPFMCCPRFMSASSVFTCVYMNTTCRLSLRTFLKSSLLFNALFVSLTFVVAWFSTIDC